jgi:hypothetical protein
MPSAKRALAGLIVVSALGAPGAQAQEKGVFIDPDSPAGEQYALPIEKARRGAVDGGKTAKVRPGEQTAPLFGAGVGPDRTATGKGSKTAGRTRDTASRTVSPGTLRRERRRVASGLATARAEGGSSDDALVLAAGGGGVLLLCAIGGLAARRLRSG